MRNEKSIEEGNGYKKRIHAPYRGKEDILPW